MKCRCDNCHFECEHVDLKSMRDLEERLDHPLGHPDCSVPAGECPRCGALSYAVDGVPRLDLWLTRYFSNQADQILCEALLDLRAKKIQALATVRLSGIKPGGREFEALDFGIPDIDQLLMSAGTTPPNLDEALAQATVNIQHDDQAEHLYLVQVIGDTEPCLHGPYLSPDELEDHARELRAVTDADGLFALSISSDRQPSIGYAL